MIFNIEFVVLPQRTDKSVFENIDWVVADSARKAVQEVVENGLLNGRVPRGRVVIVSIALMKIKSAGPKAAKYEVVGYLDPRVVCVDIPQSLPGNRPGNEPFITV